MTERQRGQPEDLVASPGQPSLSSSHGIFGKQVDLKHILPNNIFLKKTVQHLREEFYDI